MHRVIGRLLLLTCLGGTSACGDAPAQPVAPTATTTASTTAPSTFRLTSAAVSDGGTLPAEYTCDGAAAAPPLAWENPPTGTRELALLMTTLPGDGTTKWNWVLYAIPSSVTSLARNATGIGTLGVGSDGPQAAYQPPCSQGPGAKTYTFTVYALSASPQLPTGRVDGATLTTAIAPVRLASASLSVSYTRSR